MKEYCGSLLNMPWRLTIFDWRVYSWNRLSLKRMSCEYVIVCIRYEISVILYQQDFFANVSKFVYTCCVVLCTLFDGGDSQTVLAHLSPRDAGRRNGRKGQMEDWNRVDW